MSRKPREIADYICSVCEGKVKTPVARLLLLAILAGVYVGFGGYLFLIVTSDAATYVGHGVAALLGGVTFSLGLILIVLGGAELFTGNGLLTVSCLSKKISTVDVLKNWVIVYFGNFLGSLLLVGFIFAAGSYAAYDGSIAVRILQVSSAKASLSFWPALLRGILCNWLVCLAVWLAGSAEDTTGKILAIVFPISAFIAMGLEHSVANMFIIPFGMLLAGDPALVAKAGVDAGSLNAMGLFGNLLPVTIGNLIGGALFVAAVYWYIYLHESAK
jgi:formate/nitrite transporter